MLFIGGPLDGQRLDTKYNQIKFTHVRKITFSNSGHASRGRIYRYTRHHLKGLNQDHYAMLYSKLNIDDLMKLLIRNYRLPKEEG